MDHIAHLRKCNTMLSGIHAKEEDFAPPACMHIMCGSHPQCHQGVWGHDPAGEPAGLKLHGLGPGIQPFSFFQAELAAFRLAALVMGGCVRGGKRDGGARHRAR